MLLAIPYSPRKCSTELIPTWSSRALRLHPVSQGAGQTRPITDGNGLASVKRRKAYSCQGMAGLPSAPTGGFSVPRTMARSVSYTHLRAHETDSYLVCRLLLEK